MSETDRGRAGANDFEAGVILELEDRPLVHQVKLVEVKKGLRIVKVNCGADIPPDKSNERPTAWTAWTCDVTCEACKPPRST